MKLFTILLCTLSLLILDSRIANAQDDCPAGHVRNPAISPLDHEYMVSAYKASFKGLFGRDPSMQPGSGKDDGEYWVNVSNHYGVYGDDQCHAGWSGYWESWLSVGHGDLALVQTPAHFLPGATPIPVPTPTPTPSPVPEGVLIGKIDNITARLEALLALETEHVRADGDAHATINQNVSDGRAENRSFFNAVAEHWKSITAIAAPFVTYTACHYTGKC